MIRIKWQLVEQNPTKLLACCSVLDDFVEGMLLQSDSVRRRQPPNLNKGEWTSPSLIAAGVG